MIRLIAEQVPEPMWLVLCDHPACGGFATQPLSSTEQQEMDLVKALASAGWSIALRGHYCPYHTAQAQQARKLVSLASSMPGSVSKN